MRISTEAITNLAFEPIRLSFNYYIYNYYSFISLYKFLLFMSVSQNNDYFLLYDNIYLILVLI